MKLLIGSRPGSLQAGVAADRAVERRRLLGRRCRRPGRRWPSSRPGTCGRARASARPRACRVALAVESSVPARHRLVRMTTPSIVWLVVVVLREGRPAEQPGADVGRVDVERPGAALAQRVLRLPLRGRVGRHRVPGGVDGPVDADLAELERGGAPQSEVSPAYDSLRTAVWADQAGPAGLLGLAQDVVADHVVPGVDGHGTSRERLPQPVGSPSSVLPGRPSASWRSLAGGGRPWPRRRVRVPRGVRRRSRRPRRHGRGRRRHEVRAAPRATARAASDGRTAGADACAGDPSPSRRHDMTAGPSTPRDRRPHRRDLQHPARAITR